jgi:mono/diheme cytochrome c family protein
VTSKLRITTLAMAAALAMVATGCAHATASSATPSFTAAQAQEGEQAYQSACVACHMADLLGGGGAPPLAGPSFASRWDGHPFAELPRFMREHMPRTIPGVLNDRTYLAVAAYVLAKNGVTTGESPLTFEATGTILIGSR